MGLSGKSKTIPSVFRNIQLCLKLHCDYWTLMLQPKLFIDLLDIYINTTNKVEEEQSKKMQSKSKRYGR